MVGKVGAGVVGKVGAGATFSLATTDGEAVDDEETYPEDEEDEPRSAPRLPPEAAGLEPKIPLLNPRLASARERDSRLKLSSPLRLLGKGGRPALFDIFHFFVHLSWVNFEHNNRKTHF